MTTHFTARMYRVKRSGRGKRPRVAWRCRRRVRSRRRQVEARSSAATRSASDGLRTARVTAAPAPARARAVSVPIPDAAPLTIACRPERSTPQDDLGCCRVESERRSEHHSWWRAASTSRSTRGGSSVSFAVASSRRRAACQFHGCARRRSARRYSAIPNRRTSAARQVDRCNGNRQLLRHRRYARRMSGMKASRIKRPPCRCVHPDATIVASRRHRRAGRTCVSTCGWKDGRSRLLPRADARRGTRAIVSGSPCRAPT